MSAAHDYNASIGASMLVTAPADQQAHLAALCVLLGQQAQAQTTGYTLTTPAGEQAELPAVVLALLTQVMEVLAQGEGVMLVPMHETLTIPQCAHILNISHAYLTELLGTGVLPYQGTGIHRRVHIQDVLAYKHQRDQARLASLDALIHITQELGGYEHDGSSGSLY